MTLDKIRGYDSEENEEENEGFEDDYDYD